MDKWSALVVIAFVIMFFGGIAFESYNEHKLESQRIQFKIDSLKAIGGK